MAISNDLAISERIVELKSQGHGLLRIQKWLMGWDNFNQLDQQIALAHILNVYCEYNIPVNRSEIKRCFNLHYKRAYHGDSQSYLKWLVSLSKKSDNSHSKPLLLKSSGNLQVRVK